MYQEAASEFTENSRINKLKENCLLTKPAICLERAKIVTAVYKETEGEPEIIRRAKGLAKILSEMTIYIQEGELIVGNQSSKLRAAVVCPEWHTDWLLKEIDDPKIAPDKRKTDKFIITAEDKRVIKEEILPYWTGKTVEKRVLSVLSEEAIEKGIPSIGHPNVPPGPENYLRNGLSHWSINYEKLLKRGLNSIKSEAELKLESLDYSEPDSFDKTLFYRSVIIVCNGIMEFAGRYARLAQEKAEKETDPKRKKELEMISKNCQQVPAYPAETFWQAVQCFWFATLIMHIEQDNLAVSPGRFDQYMFDFYEKDVLESRTISKEEGLELVKCLFIKMSEMTKLWDYGCARYFAGFPFTQCIVVGGQKANGEDATNDVTYLVLEAEKQVGMIQPELGVRVHKRSPIDLLMKAAEVVRVGRGKPKFFFDDTAICELLNSGVESYDEARNYCIIGCVEPVTPNNTMALSNISMFNLAKCLELALNNGVCMLTKQLIGPATGDARNFLSFDDIIEAFKKQVAYFVKQMVIVCNAIQKAHKELTPYPFTSIFIEDCMEKGMDITAGGAHYNFNGPQGVGIADVADSLRVIGKIVFEDKIMSMKELIQILDEDFKGKEDIRQLFLNGVPKYGNNDYSVDSIARDVGRIYCDEVSRYKTFLNGKYRPGLYPVSANVSMGTQVGALPSGRKALMPLADGVSPSQGKDVNGPTATINSISRLDHKLVTNGTLVNMKFSPAILKGPENLGRFVQLLRTAGDMGLLHIQYNVVSRETLLDAKRNPDKYRGLLVRVAGYSAYFIELDPDVQDDIINRTEVESMA